MMVVGSYEWFVKYTIKQTPKKDRNYEFFCKKFRESWARLKELLSEGDKAISDWDKDMFLYDWEDSDETMCEHFYDGMPAWKQYYSSRGNMCLPRNHVSHDLEQLKSAKKYFKDEIAQTSLF